MYGKPFQIIDFNFFTDELFDCGFETDFCSMVQDTNDDFDWIRGSGYVSVYGTGPELATYGDVYAYIDSTYQKGGDTARCVRDEHGKIYHFII